MGRLEQGEMVLTVWRASGALKIGTVCILHRIIFPGSVASSGSPEMASVLSGLLLFSLDVLAYFCTLISPFMNSWTMLSKSSTDGILFVASTLVRDKEQSLCL